MSMNLENNGILVTGASGQSAQFFFERLVKENYQKKIKCLLRADSKVDHLKSFNLKFEFTIVDFNNIESLKSSMKGMKTLLNIAGIRISEQIIRAGTEAGINWFICVHTTGRFSKFKTKSAKYIEIEDRLLNKFSNLTILRPTMIYGSSRDKNMHKLIKYMHKSRFFPVFGNGKNLMSPIHAKDLGDAYYDVLQNRNSTLGKQYNLTGKDDITYISILKETSSLMEKKIIFVYLPFWFCLASVYLLNLVFKSNFPVLVEQVYRMKEDKIFSSENALADFGFLPMSFKEGMSIQVKEFLNKT